MKKVCMWLAIASLVGVAACKNDDPFLGHAELHLSLDTVNISGKGGTVSLVVFIDGNPHWSVSGGKDWCTLSRTSGDGFGEGEGDTVIITIAENLSLDDARATDLVFTAGDATRIVYIAQKTAASVLGVVTDRPIILGGSDTTIVLQIESNGPNDWTAQSNADWLTIISSPPSGNGNGEITIHVAANPQLKQRSAMVTLTSDTVARRVIIQTPGGPIPAEKTTWKVLWRICPALDAYVTLTKKGKDTTYHFQNFMTEKEINIVKAKAALFEEFVEARGNRVDIDITFDVWQDTIRAIDVIGNGIFGPRDAKLFDFRQNYDSQILSADYSGMTTDWRGITYPNERYSIVPFKLEEGDDYRWGYSNSEQADTYNNGLFVHEWLHQLEWWFPSIGYNMPTLHNNGEAKYTGANPELAGKDSGMEWYGDMIGGCIKSYPGSTNLYVGVYAGWWQFHPLNPSGE
ncbi:MAG: BACON domain-containing protein [Prevotellaceae bacterium]|jgi:hypothetical protein|nr:BACON domain-containing protein [Prevotellaceae bacterium]